MKKDEEKKKLDKIMKEGQRKVAEMMAQIEAIMKEVKRPKMFYGMKVKSFVNECREYVEIKMKREKMKDQILWVLTCMDGEMVNKWKEMIEDDLKKGLREYVTLEEFFGEIRKEFGRKDKDKGKKTEEDIERGMDGFWKAVKGKEVKKKETLIVEATMPRKQTARREGKSGF